MLIHFLLVKFLDKIPLSFALWFTEVHMIWFCLELERAMENMVTKQYEEVQLNVFC